MTDHDYPHTGYGVEVRTAEGWALLEGIHRTRADAAKIKQSLTSPFEFRADDLRVVALTITRKEATE